MLERGVFPRIAGGRTTLTLVHTRHVADGAVLAATTEGVWGRKTGRGPLARHAAGTLAMLTRDNPFDSSRARRSSAGRRTSRR